MTPSKHLLQPLIVAVPGLMTAYACYLTQSNVIGGGSGFSGDVTWLAEDVITTAQYNGSARFLSGHNGYTTCGSVPFIKINEVVNVWTTSLIKSKQWSPLTTYEYVESYLVGGNNVQAYALD